MTEQLLDFSDLYPGRFIKAGNLHGKPVTFTIKSIEREDLQGEKGLEPKIILRFEETPLALVLPKINAVCVKAMFGPHVQEWIGRRITLYGTTKIMPLPTKKDQPCIRIWGSPDISEPVRCEWSPPRRKPIVQVLQPVQSELVTSALGVIANASSVDALQQIQARLAARLQEGRITDVEFANLQEAARAREDALQPPDAPEPAEQAADTQQDLTVAVEPRQLIVAAFEALPPHQRKKARDLFFVRFSDLPPGTIATSVTTDEHVTALAEILAGLGG
jgi:hypothetical protein